MSPRVILSTPSFAGFLGSRVTHWSSAGVSHVDTQLEREGYRIELPRADAAAEASR